MAIGGVALKISGAETDRDHLTFLNNMNGDTPQSTLKKRTSLGRKMRYGITRSRDPGESILAGH